MKINAKEEVKELVIKSVISLDADIRINFVEQVDNETLVIKNNFLNQEFAYFCKSANDYLEEITKQYLFDFQKNDEVFVFYGEKFKSSADLMKKNYPGVRIIKLDGDYDELVKRVFQLSGSYDRADLINRLIQEEEINFVPRPREYFEKIYILAGYDQSKNLVPSLKFNFILKKPIYVSSKSVTRIVDRKKLLDFSEVILAVPNSFIEDDLSDLNELAKLSFLQDLLLKSAIKKIMKIRNFNSWCIDVVKFGNRMFSFNFSTFDFAIFSAFLDPFNKILSINWGSFSSLFISSEIGEIFSTTISAKSFLNSEKFFPLNWSIVFFRFWLIN